MTSERRQNGTRVDDLFFAVHLVDGVVRDANRALATHTGWDLSEIVGSHWARFVHPDDRQGVVKAAERIVAERACRWTCRLIHAGGESVVYHCDATLGSDGHVAYVSASDSRVLAQQREDLWQYARLSDLADDLFVVSDRLGNVVTINAAAERLHGVRREACIGRPITDFLPPESAETLARIPARWAAGEETVRYTLQVLDRHGRPVDLECVTTFDRDTQRWYTVERDMTERVARERQLEISQRFFDLSASQLVLLDPDGAIRQANPAFLSFVAADHERVTDRPIWQVLRAEREPALRTALHRAVGSGAPEMLRVAVGTGGHLRTLAVTLTPADDGTVVFFSSRDITEEERLADELLERATVDQLTRLANRRVFDEALEGALQGGQPAGVIMIDLDEFKRVNDTLGHDAGDQLLSLVAARLVNAVRADDLVARFGGDEFVVLLCGQRATRDTASVAEKIRRVLSEPYSVEGRVLHVTTSLGVAVGSSETHTASRLFREADAAAYLAKRSGKDQSRVFDTELEQTILDEQIVESELRWALANGTVDVDVQGIFTTDGTMVGLEAIARIVGECGTRMGPERFGAVATKLRLLGRLGDQVVERSLVALGPWLAAHPAHLLSLNIDAGEVAVPGFPERFAEAVDRQGIDPGQLVVEVSEIELAAVAAPALASLDALRRRGFRLAIDGFGGGASSLGYLRQLDIDTLKIDRGFIESIAGDTTTQAITGAVVEAGPGARGAGGGRRGPHRSPPGTAPGSGLPPCPGLSAPRAGAGGGLPGPLAGRPGRPGGRAAPLTGLTSLRPMPVAKVLFDVLGPVAALIGLGAVVGPRLGIDPGSLSRLAYWVFGPAFVFGLLAGADLDRSVVLRLVAAALAGMVAALAVALAWSRATGAGYELGAAVAMTSMWGNVGNAGLAIVAFALGDDALPIAGVLMVTINLASLVVGVGMAQARTAPIGAAVVRGLTAPMSVSGAVALAVNLTDLDVPLLADRSIGLLADALIPVMLLTLGLQLVSSGRPAWSNDLAVVLGAKLVAAPLAAFAAGSALGLAGDPLAAVVIQSAMPPAVFCAVVAAENGLMPQRVTAAVVLATVASAATLPVVLLLV